MEAIAEVFNEVQESTTVSQKQVYALLEQYEQNKVVFIRAVEQCYLKIIKNMLKAPRKLIEKYEKLTEKLFETGYRQYALKEDISDAGAGGKKQKLTKRDIFSLFQHFLSFFAGALDSTQLQIRIFSSRIVFQLLKILPSEVLEDVIETRIAKQLILGTLSLMKEKKGNLKQIGIKITSYLQKLMDRNDLTESQESKVLRSEMMRSMCMDEQDQIRKLALINLEMNESTFPHLIKRIRDKNPEIRATVFKKLIKEQIPLANLNLSDVYKLIYDGLGSREASVRDACTRYLSLNYCLFKEESDGAKLDNEMDLEDKENADGEEKTIPSEKKGSAKRFFTANKESATKEMKINIINFLQTFEVEKSLYYPELYESLEALVKETVRSILDADGLAGYLKDVFVNQLSLKKKRKHTKIEISSEELLLVRVVCQMAQNPEERKELSPEIVAVIEDCFPNGAEFAQVMEYYATTAPSLFSLYQALLTAELLINCDEAGRNKLEETLKNLVRTMNNAQLVSEIPTDEAGEYNDIFYELDAETVKNSIFAQAYFQPPIITCAYELLPIIVRIFKKVVSDGRANVQLIQLISEVHEPLAKDTDNDSHFDLPSELERLRRAIKDGEVKTEAIEKELVALKKNKTKQREIYELEKQKDDASAHLSICREKEEQIQIKIFDISMRQLILVQSLLTNCKVDPKDHAISHLLQQIIMPGLNSEDDNLIAHALKALALYVLIDRNVCNDFFSVFQDLLAKNEQCAQSSPQEIISLRSIVDFILLYDLANKATPDEDEIDISFTQELILRYAYQADTLLRTIAIEGLSKLLFNGKLQDPHTIICLLMVIWFDTKICQREGFKAIQILSTLFKTFTATNYANLVVFEKALELFTLLIVTLEKKGLVFNDDFVLFDHLNEKFTSKALRVGVNLLSYEYHKNTEALTNAAAHDLPPQERFFVYLAYRCSKDKRFLNLFDKITHFFDFYGKSQLETLPILLHFLREALENCPLSKQLHQLEKLIKDKIKAASQADKIEDDAPEPAQNENAAEAADANAEDEKLFALSARQKKIVERITENIENNGHEMDVIVKNLTDSKILVQDTLEQKEKRAKLDDEDEEEEVPDFVEEEEEPAEKEEVKPRQRGGRGGKRKAPHASEGEDEEEEQQEIVQVAPKKREAPKRGRKTKEIEEVVSEEDNDDEEEDKEEIIQKRTSQRRTRKTAEETAPSKKRQEQDEEDEEEEEEEEQVITKANKTKKDVSNSRRGRGKKVQQEEEVDSEKISEEEEDEEEQKPKQRNRRGGKQNDEEEEPKPKGNRQTKKKTPVKRSKGKQISNDNEDEEEQEEDEDNEQPKKRTRSGRKQEPQSESEENVEEEEEADGEEEEEEEVEEVEIEEQPKKGNKKGKGNQNTRSTRGRGKNVKEEEEDEEEEEVVVLKENKAKVNKTAAQGGRRTSSRVKNVKEEEDDEAEEEEQEVPEKKRSGRGGRNQKGKGAKKAETSEESNEEEEQEEEIEEIEEDVPKRSSRRQKKEIDNSLAVKKPVSSNKRTRRQ